MSKLSEIRARTARACEKGQYHYFPAASHALFHDIPDLLDLVKRMGEVLEEMEKDYPADPECWPIAEKARELLKEIER